MCTSTAVLAMKMPDRPPTTNWATKAMANIMAAVKRMLPPHKVPSQLNVLIADGTAMNIVLMANVVPSVGFMPLWNMWRDKTRSARTVMPGMALIIMVVLTGKVVLGYGLMMYCIAGIAQTMNPRKAMPAMA